eukprot:SAG11_NODE_16038_length_558_cov_2.113290_1_plen_89_part_00
MSFRVSLQPGAALDIKCFFRHGWTKKNIGCEKIIITLKNKNRYITKMYIIEQNGFWYDGWYYTTDYDDDGNVEYLGKKYVSATTLVST